MDNVARLLLRFILVPLGYFVAAVVGTLVILIASWRLLEIGGSGDPDAAALAVMGFVVGGPVLLILVLAQMLLPASVGILISEAFALRSWIFHVLNGVVSAWLGWTMFIPMVDGYLPLQRPAAVIAAGIAGGLAYWMVAGFSAGFWQPVFRRPPSGTAATPAIPQ